MIAAFGEHAERVRDALPPELDAVVFDRSGIPAALLEGARRQERGGAFYGLAVIDDFRVSLCNAIAVEVNQTVLDREERHYTTSALGMGNLKVNGEPVRRLWDGQGVGQLQAFGNVLMLADELLVRSYLEYARYCAAQGVFKRRPFRRILLADTVPPFAYAGPTRPSVVVWTGRRSTETAALALIGLEEFRGDVTYVGDQPLPNIAARFVARAEPVVPELLAAAGCVVCIDPGDPADAVAFARRGVPVVAPATCAAYEFAHGIVSWDAGNAHGLYRAVALALGRTPSGMSPDTIPPRPPVLALPAGPDALPLVSIITATYNRRDHLRKMLTCLAAQSYPNIESVVVNDAGEPVDDIVAAFPFARLIDAEVNGGTLKAAELGLAAARGTYIGLLPDDDWLYPDHVERLMAAILRSGAAVAHGNSLLRFLRREEGGTERTYGFNPDPYSSTINPTGALVGTPIAGHQCLQRRDTFAPDDVGWYLNDAAGADQEYHMRLIERHQLVWLDAFTCEFRDHEGNTGKRYNWEQEMRYIYESVQPLSGRPLTEAIRNATLERLRNVPVGKNVNVPLFTF